MPGVYKGFFKGWELAVTRRLVNEFQGKCELLRREEPEDLIQECLVT
jgi:hypothetical protein